MTMWDSKLGMDTMTSIENGMRKLPDMADFSMRDYFATAFMSGYCSNLCKMPSDMESIAEGAYKMADAMIKARNE